MPDRIQLRRTRGWRLREGAVVVTRPGRWGNPYVVHKHSEKCGDEHLGCPPYCVDDAEEAARRYRHAVLYPVQEQPSVPTPDEIRAELAGRDLACWCPTSGPCHADVLIEIANTEEKTDA